ncbi:ATP-dependent 6-phosphofructokinase [Pelagicoccus mobilis]|uniref:ATP-dependent 6-phosphofructokinase n=1 Tax=Pelagicoccus mobilis TaxID=415221 RepID=A0A934S6E1_9BACT|nr:ATP-dependent 6-phosphofructokinase [Pelagicoccus mobilis]MBK1880224.1 ATP-dependent 6-phosphofructokinase [Pelagicoccus mobilis]
MDLDLSKFDFNVETLGECQVPSPLVGERLKFVSDDERIVAVSDSQELSRYQEELGYIPSMETAGPRAKVFQPQLLARAAIVTCGGLCPGLNSVIKGVVETLNQEYGIKDVFGIHYGYAGLADPKTYPPVMLDADKVDTLHMEGGSILGTSRGGQDVETMVQNLVNMRINMLFTIGGDGTLKGAAQIAKEIKRRGLEISVVGVPKTIDNDLQFVGSTFGFETAVYQSTPVITAAHVEARSVYNGLGIVKLMGRDSGFICANAALANPVVNFCLIPEDEWTLDGPNGLLKAVERRFRRKSHAIIAVAEGAGQSNFNGLGEERDASGNVLKHDIGTFLCDRFKSYFADLKIPVSLKYFDPSYSIRSVPASGTDQILCHRLAEYAVHAAMAGKTNMVIGYWNRSFVNVPIPVATYERHKIDINGSLWRSVLACTGQEKYFKGRSK